MSQAGMPNPAAAVAVRIVRLGLAAIKRGEIETGSQLIDGAKACFDEPSRLSTWKALALIQAGEARSALEEVSISSDDFGEIRDQREATRALAMRTLEINGWQAICDRIFSTSRDPVALEMAARIQAWQ